MAAQDQPAGRPPDFGLPEAVLSVIPSDPFEQLDVARKITSIALATRISKLESEAAHLRQRLAEKDDLVAELRAKVETFDASLADVSDRLARAHEEKETLLSENASLSNTIKKLNRDASKLQIFKKTLMQSLQEEEESPQIGAPRVVPEKMTDTASFLTGSLGGDKDPALPPLNSSSVQSQFSETASSISVDGGYSETDGSRQGKPYVLLTSQGSTPRLTPPDSPPRRRSISFSTTRNLFDERSSIFSSLPSSHHHSLSSPFDPGAQTGRTRVDGKEFFRQVRYIQSVFRKAC